MMLLFQIPVGVRPERDRPAPPSPPRRRCGTATMRQTAAGGRGIGEGEQVAQADAQVPATGAGQVGKEDVETANLPNCTCIFVPLSRRPIVGMQVDQRDRKGGELCRRGLFANLSGDSTSRACVRFSASFMRKRRNIIPTKYEDSAKIEAKLLHLVFAIFVPPEDAPKDDVNYVMRSFASIL